MAKEPKEFKEAKEPKKLNTDIGQVNSLEITEEMRNSYINYAMSVIVARALPDVRDGLKPVQRRILYTMNEMGLVPGARFRKSAAITGSVLARYHPHGDLAVYAAMARMAQDFSLRYPLIKPQGNFGCFTKDTKVRLCDGRNLNFGELIEEQKKGIKHWTFSFNHQTQEIEIAEIKKARETRENERIIEIITDNGEKIKCTLSHKFLLRNGKYRQAKNLKAGDSLMPSYFKNYTGEEDANLKGYEMIKQPFKNNWTFVHRLTDKWNLENKIYLKSAGKIRHHLDFDKLNNNPDNIKRIQWGDHWKYHQKIASQRHKNNPQYVEAIAEGRKKFWAKKENRDIYSRRQSERNKILWQNPKYRQAWIKARKKKWQDQEYKEFMRKASSKNLRGLWQRKDFQELMSEIKSKEMKARWQDKEYQDFWRCKTKEISKKIWATPGHREYISNLMKEKSNEAGWRKKKSEIAKALWQNQEYRKKFSKDHFREMAKKSRENSESEKVHRQKSSIVGQSKEYNHKVISVKVLRKKEDVYDLTVRPWHNFLLAAGVFVHNSIDGDPPAAARYTEAKLSKIGALMLKDIEKETVNFVDNYDGTHKEPTVLPSPVPQLLLNGALGIAVGMATKIPPHNLNEICDAAIYSVDHPRVTIEDLFQFIQGPDFPTGGIIYNKKGLLEAYSEGSGPVKIRGRAEIVESKNGFQIIISEIPFGIQKSALLIQIAKLVQDQKIEKVKDIRDESDQDGLRVVIELKEGAFPQKILNFLYKRTSLQTTFHLNMVALINGLQPKVLNLVEMLQEFIAYREEVILKRTKFDKRKAEERAHILEGFHIALKNIDEVIKVIKSSKDREEAQKNLIKRFRLTEIQASAILDMRLSALAKLERQKIEDELKAIILLIKELSEIIKSPKRIKEILKKELEEAKKEFGDERKTKVFTKDVGEISAEDLIPQEPTVVILTKEGFIKRLKPSIYRVQKRGGKGVIGVKTREEDFVDNLLFASTHDDLLFFTDSGKVFKTKAYEIPEATRIAKGKSLLNFLEISSEEKVLAVLPMPKNETDRTHFIMATKKGLVKKAKIADFENVRRTGLIAIRLKKGDLLTRVQKAAEGDEVILVTRKGKAIRFSERDARTMGRSAAGVRGIRLGKNDEVIGAEIIRKPKAKAEGRGLPEGEILVLSENGYGKRTKLSQYRAQNRGGSGIKTAQITAKTGDLVAVKTLEGKEEYLILISQKAQVIKINLTGVSRMGRATQGVRIIKLEKGDKVASITCE